MAHRRVFLGREPGKGGQCSAVLREVRVTEGHVLAPAVAEGVSCDAGFRRRLVLALPRSIDSQCSERSAQRAEPGRP